MITYSLSSLDRPPRWTGRIQSTATSGTDISNGSTSLWFWPCTETQPRSCWWLRQTLWYKFSWLLWSSCYTLKKDLSGFFLKFKLEGYVFQSLEIQVDTHFLPLSFQCICFIDIFIWDKTLMNNKPRCKTKVMVMKYNNLAHKRLTRLNQKNQEHQHVNHHSLPFWLSQFSCWVPSESPSVEWSSGCTL